MSDTPHYAMIQVDLDGLDSVLDCYGSALGEQETDTVYADGVVRLLDLLKEFDLKATFFLIGRDAEIPYKRRVLERLVREGHELGNHTYSHPLGFARLSMEEQRSEIERCSTLIRELSGREPVGFRAPGYAITGQVVNFLEELRFSYDASVFPCACSFLIRAWQSLFSPSQFEEEKYGASIHAVAPQSPYLPDREKVYRVSSEEREICEVPVSTTRLFRLPFHGSYVMVFSKLVKNLGLWYWRAGFDWYRRNGIPYVFVIHPLELTDIGNDKRLKAQIGYDIPVQEKLSLYRSIFSTLKKRSLPVTTADFVENHRLGGGYEKQQQCA